MTRFTLTPKPTDVRLVSTGFRMHPRKPPRLTRDNALYFLTFCTSQRRPLLHRPGIAEFVIDELHFYKAKIEELIAYTIMPDHVHLILEISSSETLSIFLRDL
ncbi:MAG: transposase, partial [Bacteroidota bacterium]